MMNYIMCQMLYPTDRDTKVGHFNLQGPISIFWGLKKKSNVKYDNLHYSDICVKLSLNKILCMLDIYTHNKG